MEQSPYYNNGGLRPRNGPPTPPSAPTTTRNQQRTVNPNAYESSADIVARRNAENAQMNRLRGMGGRDMTQYSAGNFAPQMPQLPRLGMQGLDPQAPNQFQTPFHYYPDFGSEQHMMKKELEMMIGDINNEDAFEKINPRPPMAPMRPMNPMNPMDGVPDFNRNRPSPIQGGMQSMGRNLRKGIGAMGGLGGLGMSLADMTPEEINQMYLYLSQGGAFQDDGIDPMRY